MEKRQTNIEVRIYLKMLHIISLFLVFFEILENNSMDLERNDKTSSINTDRWGLSDVLK